MKKPVLSVIVPVYNVEKYLEKCLDSLAHQTLRNFEVIIVNDGTEDGSQNIIDKYVEKKPETYKSYYKENGGISDARNFGLMHANGEFVTFLDSDDYVDSNYYQEMCDLAVSNNCDVVVSNIEYDWANNEKAPFFKKGLNEEASNNIKKALFMSPLSVCNKVFRRELFNKYNILFYTGIRYEDIPVALLMSSYANRVAYNKNSVYHYLQRSSSFLGSGYSSNVDDLFTIFEKTLEEFKVRELYEKYYYELEYLLIENFLVYGAFRFLRTEYYHEPMIKAFNYVRSHFPNHRKNKYIKTLGFKNRFFLCTNSAVTMPLWHWYLTKNNNVTKSSDNAIYESTIVDEINYKNTYEKDLSIVVPVYNVEKYLDKCLNSLVNQSIKNFEIIVVNDGTKDNSQNIINRYVLEYPNIIRSYIKENGGLSDARNFGVKRAKGKYICFIDSDDYVELDYYKKIVDLASKNKLDIVVSDLVYEWEKEEHSPMNTEGLKMVSGEINRRLFLSPLFAWNKLYRHELFEKLNCEYPVGLWYEDIPVTLKIFSHARRIGYYHHVGVHYLQRDTSILGSGYSPKMYDIFTIFDKVLNEFKCNDLFNAYKDELEYLFIEHFLVYGAFRFLRTNHYKDLMSKGFDYVKKEFPDFKKNKYIKTFDIKNRLFLKTNNKGTMYFWHWYLTRK